MHQPIMCVISGLRRGSWIMFLAAHAAAISPAQDEPTDGDGARILAEAVAHFRAARSGWANEVWYLDGNPDRVDPGAAQRAINDLQPVIALFRQAVGTGSRRYESNSGIAPSELTEHAQVMRDVFLAVRMDVSWRVHSGDVNGVAGDLERLVRYSTMQPTDGSLQGNLVGMAHLNSTLELVRDGAIASGQLTAAEASAMLKVVDAAVSTEMLGVGSAIDTERQRSLQWMEAMSADDADRSEMLRSLAESGVADGDVALASQLASMSTNEVTIGVAQYDLAMTRLAEAAGMTDPAVSRAAFQKVIDEIGTGVYGPIAESASLRANLVDIVMNALAEVEETRELLVQASRNPDGAMGLRNAALWYRKAIALRQRLPNNVWLAVELCAADPSVLETGAMQFPVESAQPILDLLVEAASIERCEFESLRERSRNGLWPLTDFISGMRDCATLLRAAATDRETQENPEAAHAFLAALVAMPAHLAQERLIEASDLAAEIAREHWPAVQSALNAMAPTPTRQPIEDALALIVADDPFGYVGALREYRSITVGATLRQSRSMDPRQRLIDLVSRLERIEATVFDANAGALLAELAQSDAAAVRAVFEAIDDVLVSILAEAPTIDAPDGVGLLEEVTANTVAESETLRLMPEWANTLLAPVFHATTRRIESEAIAIPAAAH